MCSFYRHIGKHYTTDLGNLCLLHLLTVFEESRTLESQMMAELPRAYIGLFIHISFSLYIDIYVDVKHCLKCIENLAGNRDVNNKARSFCSVMFPSCYTFILTLSAYRFMADSKKSRCILSKYSFPFIFNANLLEVRT